MLLFAFRATTGPLWVMVRFMARRYYIMGIWRTGRWMRSVGSRGAQVQPVPGPPPWDMDDGAMRAILGVIIAPSARQYSAKSAVSRDVRRRACAAGGGARTAELRYIDSATHVADSRLSDTVECASRDSSHRSTRARVYVWTRGLIMLQSQLYLDVRSG